MKKSLIYTSVASLTLLAGVTTTALLNNASAEPNNSGDNAIAVLTDQTTLGASLTSKNETVYVITDNAGAPTKTFIGNILESTNSDLPVDIKITYSLDGKAISATDLAGQSGHVKIIFDYSSTKTYQGKYIPFLTLTGLSLDDTKFKNIKVDNGKIIKQSESTMIAGYAVTGLNENLGTDVLPSSFTIEADVTDFELGTTYTLATNEIFAEIDVSKLSSLDNLISSMNELESGINQILDGATSLDEGVDSLVAGIEQLQSGATSLNAGANELAAGLTSLDDQVNAVLVPKLESLAGALGSLSGNSEELNTKIRGSYTTLLSSLQAVADNTTDNTTKAALEQIIASTRASLPTLYYNLGYYTGVVDLLAAETANLDTTELTGGISALKDGANQLLDGTIALKTGTDALADGASQLSSGSKALKDGVTTFKRDGIDQLVDFANNDVESFLNNFRSSVSAAKSYHSYKSTSAETVKFIFKTPSVK